MLLAQTRREDVAQNRVGDKRDHHADGTAVDGAGDERCVEDQAQCHVDHREAHAPDKADPHRRLGGALHVEAVEERREEATGEGAPTVAHELGDEDNRAVVLEHGQRRGDDNEHREQGAHPQKLGLLAHVLLEDRLDEVERERGARGENQGAQRGHRGREHHDDDDADEDVGQTRQHRGDDRVVDHGASRGVDGNAIGKESAKAAQEVAAAGNDQRKEGGDDRTFGNCGLRLDGVELLHHLRQAPSAKGGQDDHAKQVERVGTEHTREDAGDPSVGNAGVGDLRQVLECLDKAALAVEHAQDDGDDRDEHDDSLHRVIEGCGRVATPDDIDAGDDRHGDDACLIRQAKGHAKQARQAVVDRRCIGDQEDEDDKCRGDAQRVAVKALAKELRHGLGVEVVGHDARAATEHEPRQKRADEHVADTGPKRRKAEFPTKLTRVADENDSGEVARAVRKRGHPRTDLTTSQNEAVDALRLLAAVEADVDSCRHEDDQQRDLETHESLPLLEPLSPKVMRARYHAQEGFLRIHISYNDL